MKKIITTLLIAAMLTGTLAGCGGENPENSGAASDTGNSTSSGESSTSSAESGTSSAESSTSSAESSASSAESGASSNESGTSSNESGTSSAESSTSSGESSTSSAESSTSSAESGASSNDSGSSSAEIGASSNDSGTSEDTEPSVGEGKSPIERLNAVFSQFEIFSKPGESINMLVGGPDKDAIRAVFPEFEDPTKPTHCVRIVEEGPMVAGVIGVTQLDLNDCEDYVVAGPMISAQLKRFVIAKPKAGREEAVKKALSEYAEVSKNPPSGTWMGYPGWEKERAGTYFGETDDGCFYVIVAAEGAEMGSAIENA